MAAASARCTRQSASNGPAECIANHDVAIMISPKEEAAECRRQAAMCLEVAAQMSSHSDRDHMLALARRWTDLAEKAEARARRG
jgi:hypothetical protein